jgi:rod shape determining protein RodA
MFALLLSKLPKFDWLLMLAVFILFSVGIGAITSVELSRGGAFSFVEKQLIALGLGIILAVGAAMANAQFFRAYARILYIVGIILLAGLFVFGQTFNGTTGWYVLGGFAFQPVEVMKFALILELARYFADEARTPFGWREFFGSGIKTAIPCGLVLLQPDLGSAMLLAGIWGIVAFFGGLQWKQAATILSIGIVGFLLGWFAIFQPYQRDRVLTFLNPTADPLGVSYNIVQAQIAIGAGGLIGSGLGGGSQSQLRFLPESQSDFIFAVIAEELGFVGVMIVFGAYVLLLSRMLVIARKSRDHFASYLSLGSFALFFIQVIIHVGANLAMMPATGIPLPFVSYGGTSLLLSFAVLGIVQSAAGQVRAGDWAQIRK